MVEMILSLEIPVIFPKGKMWNDGEGYMASAGVRFADGGGRNEPRELQSAAVGRRRTARL
ncbi:hypothetical protein D1647_11900 [Alistipes sp. Z76]|nr:hypothetical protein [Alistipes sp. Z76]NCE68965.1 hypothetical protein [Muribaculaceae bacterium M3]